MATTCSSCGYPYCPSCSTCPNCGASTGCFITTAVCQNLNLPDNCYELNSLRSFRDRYMTDSPEKVALLEQYYSTAPAIVRKIEERTDKHAIYSNILSDFINPAIRAIENKHDDKAKEIYCNLMAWINQKLK